MSAHSWVAPLPGDAEVRCVRCGATADLANASAISDVICDLLALGPEAAGNIAAVRNARRDAWRGLM